MASRFVTENWLYMWQLCGFMVMDATSQVKDHKAINHTEKTPHNVKTATKIYYHLGPTWCGGMSTLR